MMTRVALVKTEDRASGIDKALDLLDAVPMSGKHVFLKPNFNSADPFPGSTHNDTLATLAPRIEKEEGELRWEEPAPTLERLIRAFTPWPGTFTYWDGRLLKIRSATAGSTPSPLRPGEVGRVGEDAVAIGTGEGTLLPQQVQLEGRSALPIEEFVRGYPDFVHAHLGPTANAGTSG